MKQIFYFIILAFAIACVASCKPVSNCDPKAISAQKTELSTQKDSFGGKYHGELILGGIIVAMFLVWRFCIKDIDHPKQIFCNHDYRYIGHMNGTFGNFYANKCTKCDKVISKNV